jgi:hypothetical protein
VNDIATRSTTSATHKVDSSDSEFCHTVCGVHENKTLCGLVDDSDTWCTHDPCENQCVVCVDLEDQDDCPICGTDCAEEQP